LRRCVILNHGRCLLANLPPAPGAAYVAEELIDPSYTPLAIPAGAQALVRHLLFGAAPDRGMINYRCRQLLTVVHATAYATYLTALDPRLTYSSGSDGSLAQSGAFAPTVTPGGAGLPDLVLGGQPAAPDAGGQLAYHYTVTVLSPTSLQVTQERPAQNPVFGITLSGGLSNPVPLGDSGYQVQVATNAPGAYWLVDVVNKPQWDMGQLAANLAYAGDAHLTELFGRGQLQPWATFRNLWLLSPDPPDRLTGLVLALIFRTELLRLGGG